MDRSEKQEGEHKEQRGQSQNGARKASHQSCRDPLTLGFDVVQDVNNAS